MEESQQDHLTNMDIEVDDQARRYLYDAGKWTKFISIVVFIACAFLLLFGVIGGAAMGTVFKRFGSSYSFFEGLEGVFFIVVIVIIVAVLVLVYYFLFNFSQKIKRALISEDTAVFNAGLRSLKTFFIITTVFAILSLLSSIYNIFK